jgi:iron(III) transport system substrate-binding protein
MRRILAALVTALSLSLPAQAFEIEEERLFPAAIVSARLHILSTTDTVVFEPLLTAYQALHPGVEIRYVVASSQEVFSAVHDEGAAFDIVISSAMDLQMKLANDGHAQAHLSDLTQSLPGWAQWRDQLFAFTQEPVVTAYAAPAFDRLALPQTRSDLIRLFRDHPDQFRGRIGTYDPRFSGAGYLFASQDARQSDTFWRLAEVMGGLEPVLYTSTNQMLDDLENGRLVLAYNVLGSYLDQRLAGWPEGRRAEPQDFTQVLLRTALIPANAETPAQGHGFLDFLISPEGQALLEAHTGLPPISADKLSQSPHLRPIRLDPGLLVYVDPLKRQRFLREWEAAVVQE